MLDLYDAKEYFDNYGFIYGDRTDGITHEIIKMDNIVDAENYLYMQKYDVKERNLIDEKTAMSFSYGK